MTKMTPAKYLVRPVDQRIGFADLPLLSVSRYKGVVPRHELTDKMARADDLSNYKVCQPGDIVVNRMSAYQGAIGRSSVAGIVSPDYLVLRPGPSVEGRFLHHLFRSTWFTSEIIQRLRGIGSVDLGNVRTPRINPDDLGSIEIPVLPLEEQRRIADFLDAETARIDQLGSHLNRFGQDLQERERAILGELLNGQNDKVGGSLPPKWRWTPLMHLTDELRQIMYGIVLPGPNVDDGVPIVKGGDVAANRLSLSLLNRTTREIEAGYARSRLKGGDLVIAIRGSVGEVAVVPDELTGANLTQDAARISIGAGVDASWLRLVLESPLVVNQIQGRVTGATIRGINIWDLKRIMIPAPDRSQQTALAVAASKVLAKHDALRERVATHRNVLAERKQALITAAVTGQIDVSTASGRGIETELR